MAERPALAVEIAGCEAVLDGAGALWLAASRTLVVSDLHLEKASSFARRGMLLPPYDTGATLAALAALVGARDPRRVICLGDSFHDRGGPDRLDRACRTAISELQRGRDWIWVAGNHDPDLPAAIGGEIAAAFAQDGLTFRHEPSAGAAPGEVAGHLHPAAKIARHGRSVRRRAFVGDGERLVLPAFGVLAGGLNVLDRAFAGLFGGAFLAFMIGERRLYPVAPHALAGD
ncbi:ligase-associated DNA damage response endonuclease PdeM [Faunimonas sp. B44]|uniref:ligase-associated DNA damage response endonuclease PdeM n=1 Tax=Faunimonas sp. B44 TaxID=3461493 RepID=UPI004044AB0F